MRISTTQLYQQSLNEMLRNQAALSRTQNKISTGKRYSLPSEDPIGASQSVLLKEELAHTKSLQSNLTSARNNLQLEDSALNSAVNILQRVRELHIQASNSFLSKSDRQAIKAEIGSRLDEMGGIANTTDSRGSYMFSGYKSSNQAYSKSISGQFIYQGDDGQRTIEVAPGLIVPMSDSGFDIFENIPNGQGTIQFSDPGGTNAGTAVMKTYDVVDQSSFVVEDYTLTFVTNSGGNLAYQVVGSVSGQLIPALPAAIPADAPDFTEGQSINFNGVQLAITGTPQVGDNFAITPSQGQSVFTTVQDFMNTLDLDNKTTQQQSVVSNQNHQTLNEIDQAIDRMIAIRTKVGGRLNTLDTADSMNEDFKLQSASLISTIEDLDYAQAVTQLNKESLALQAAQQTFVRIQGLSLFNVI